MSFSFVISPGAFEDDDVTHVEGDVNPVRDLDIISEELRLKDIQYITNKMVSAGRREREWERRVRYVYHHTLTPPPPSYSVLSLPPHSPSLLLSSIILSLFFFLLLLSPFSSSLFFLPLTSLPPQFTPSLALRRWSFEVETRSSSQNM